MSITILLCSCTCSKQVEYRDPLWSFNSFDRNNFDDKNQRGHFFDEYPVYGNNVIVPGNKNKNALFYSINTDNGKKNWELIHNGIAGFLSIGRRSPCIKDNYWYFAEKANVYRIDINNGKKKQINAIEDADNFNVNDMKSIRDYWFKWSTGQVHYGNINDFNDGAFTTIPEVKHQTKHSSENNITSYYNLFPPIPFINSAEDVCVLIHFIDIDSNDRKKNIDKISLYNITQQKYVYDGVEVFKQTSSINKKLFLDSVCVLQSLNNFDFTAQLKLFALNVNNGKLLWQINLQQGRHFVFGDKVYYTTPSNKLYIYNKQDGKLLKEVASGSNASSNMVLHNGVIYYVEEGTRLRAIDAETGESLLKMETTPDGKPFHIWASSIAVVNGKIILDNYKNVYAYPTIR